MTTVPLDDAPVGEQESGPTAVGALVEPAPRPVLDDRPPTPRRLARWRLLARWKAAGHQVLPGIWYPITLYGVWRLVQLAVSVHLGGDAQYGAFYYDAQHYLRIMHIGYVHPVWTMPSNAFFPAVSWLGWPLWKLTQSDLLTVHTVATATGLASFIAVWGVSKSLRDEHIARRAVLLFALFPSSLFLWAFYSEGLFIALGAGALWADRRGRRGVATVLFVLIGATRSVGILVPAVIVVCRIIRQRRIDKWCWAYAVAGASGLLGVLAMILLPLCSSVLASFNRFTFADWILYPVYASAIERLPRPWQIGAMSIIVISLALTAYAMIGRFSLGLFIA